MIGKLFLVVIGLALAVAGWEELDLAEGASEQPQAIELAQLENGPVVQNPHLAVGPHWRMYTEIFFTYREHAGQTEITDSTRLDHSYYPILSLEHAYVREMTQLEKLYGDEEIPEKLLPAVDDFKVLVKTGKYDRYGELPIAQLYKSDAVSGMVINRVDSLSPDEHRLIQESFPKVNVAELLILEEGRKPASPTRAYAMMGGGGALGLLAAGSFLARRD